MGVATARDFHLATAMGTAQENVTATFHAGHTGAVGVRSAGLEKAAGMLSVAAWLGLGLTGCAIVLVAAVVAAGLAIALGAGRLAGGVWSAVATCGAGLPRRRHEPRAAIVEADVG